MQAKGNQWAVCGQVLAQRTAACFVCMMEAEEHGAPSLLCVPVSSQYLQWKVSRKVWDTITLSCWVLAEITARQGGN